MTAEVYVSGFGVFSAFGFGPQALLDGVFSGTPAFRRVTRFDVSHCRTDRAAIFPGRDAGSSHAVPGLDAVEVAVGCGRQAIAMAGWRNPAELPVVLATPLRALSAEPEAAAEKTERLGDQLGLGWPRRTFVNACCAAANAIIHGAQLVRAGISSAVLVGGVFLVDRHAFNIFDAAQGPRRRRAAASVRPGPSRGPSR